MPPPSKLKRKILIKNKRLLPEVEKQELELYFQGQLDILDDEDIKEDPSAPPKDPKVKAEVRDSIFNSLACGCD